jgi:hypothetical protein
MARSRHAAAAREVASAAGLAGPRDIEQTAEHPAAQLEGLGEDEPRPISIRGPAAPGGEVFLRPEEVQACSEEAREPVAAPSAPLHPCEAPGGRQAGAVTGSTAKASGALLQWHRAVTVTGWPIIGATPRTSIAQQA